MLVRHVDALGAPLVVLGHGVEVDEHHWGNGIGTLIAANDLLFFRSLGIEYFFLPVGNQGQRFWPHLGFDFVSPEMTSQKIKEFIHFLKTENIELSPDKQRELYTIVHSWELLNFRDESERALGKEFFLSAATPWTSRFDLNSSYEGWNHLRNRLKKIGRADLLPETLGKR